MADNVEIELYRQFRAAQEKYTYFQLAGVGAAIAFAVTRTQDTLISDRLVLLAIAVLCWALSFIFGCQHLRYVASATFANIDLLKVESGRHPMTGRHPDAIELATQTIRGALETNSKRSARYANWQFDKRPTTSTA